MGSKKNVLIVHNYYQIPGGEDTVVANEMAMLNKHGHKVILYTRDNSELKEMSRINKLSLPFTTIYNRRTYKEIVKIIRNESIDVVHVHNTLNLVSAAVYYAAVKCKVPVVQTIHNYRLLCPKATFYRDGRLCEDCVNKGLACAVMHKCYRDSLAQTACCVVATKYHRIRKIYSKINYICLTDFGRNKLLSINTRNDKSAVINPDNVYVKPNFMPNATNTIVPGDSRNNKFIYAGRLDETKGIKELFEAWKRAISDMCGEFELIVCGSGPLQEWCENYIKINGISSIKMLGAVNHEEVINLLANARVMVLPTRWYEGFPMSIAESYSVGTPVIGPDMGNVGSIIREGITGIKYDAEEENDVAKLTRSLVDFANNEHRDMYLGAYNEYAGKYTEDINYELLIEIYNKVTDNNRCE